MPVELYALTAAELSAAYRDGTLSPVEVTSAVLTRIAAWEPKINAMHVLDAEGALAQARAAEGRWRSGEPLSPLDGVRAHDQGQYRHERVHHTGRHRRRSRTCGSGRFTARGQGPRGGLRHPRQDDDARHGHARLGRQQRPWHHAQSLASRSQPRRLQLRCWSGSRSGLRPPGARHRHRRLGSTARRLLRRVRAQAQPRPGAHLSAGLGPGDGANDPHGPGRGAALDHPGQPTAATG